MKSMDNTKLEGFLTAPKHNHKFQNNLERLWASSNKTRFRVEKCKILHLSRKNRMHRYMLGGS